MKRAPIFRRFLCWLRGHREREHVLRVPGNVVRLRRCGRCGRLGEIEAFRGQYPLARP